MILTSDKYPREIDGLEERLKSRFVWGLTVEVEAPELETQVAILMKKAEPRVPLTKRWLSLLLRAYSVECQNSRRIASIHR